MKVLTIINGPFLSEIDSILNNDSWDTPLDFETKEEGEKTIYPKSIEINGNKNPNVKIKNDECEIVFDSNKNSGTLTIF